MLGTASNTEARPVRRIKERRGSAATRTRWEVDCTGKEQEGKMTAKDRKDWTSNDGRWAP
jgi:hypothetical protein